MMILDRGSLPRFPAGKISMTRVVYVMFLEAKQDAEVV